MEEIMQGGSPAAPEKQVGAFDAFLEKWYGAVGKFFDRVLDFIGGLPWKKWLDCSSGLIKKYAPVAIAFAGVSMFLIAFISLVKYDAPFSYVMKTFLILPVAVFLMYLAPKAQSLTASLIEKSEPLSIRPEFLGLLKAITGIGGFALALYLLLTFNGDNAIGAIVVIVIAVLHIVVLGNPEIAGLKADYPTNCVEEVLAIVLLPFRLMFALLPQIIAIGVVLTFIQGIAALFEESYYTPAWESSLEYLAGTALLPVLAPIGLYIVYLLVMFTIDFYRSIVSIPRKIEELKK